MTRAKEIKKKFRNLKVQRQWRELRNYWQYYPTLRINGAWFELAGFQVGDYVQIEVRENQLIITNKGTQPYDHRTNQKATKYYPCAEPLQATDQ